MDIVTFTTTTSTNESTRVIETPTWSRREQKRIEWVKTFNRLFPGDTKQDKMNE